MNDDLELQWLGSERWLRTLALAGFSLSPHFWHVHTMLRPYTVIMLPRMPLRERACRNDLPLLVIVNGVN